MVNLFDRAREIINSFSSIIHRSETNLNDVQVSLPLRNTGSKKTRQPSRETEEEPNHSLNSSKKRKTSTSKKESPKSSCSTPWQIMSGTASPQITPYIVRPMQVSSTRFPSQSRISSRKFKMQSPGNRSQSVNSMNQICLSSTSSTPIFRAMRTLSSSQSLSLNKYFTLSLRIPEPSNATELSLLSRTSESSSKPSEISSPEASKDIVNKDSQVNQSDNQGLKKSYKT